MALGRALGVLALVGAALGATASAPPPAHSDAAPALERLARSGRHPDLHWPRFHDLRPDVEQFYERAGWQFAWLEGERPTAAAIALIARLAASDSLGLEPIDYDAEWLELTADGLSNRDGTASAAEAARFDLGLTVAAIRFAKALSIGRVSPRVVHAEVFVPVPLPVLALAVDSLRDAGLQADVLERLQPTFHHYRLLKNGLAHYRTLARDSSLELSSPLPKDLKPGARLRGAARLRRRLEAMGDLAPARKPPKVAADTLYTADLVEAVKRFQRRHGLEPDGVIHPGTADELSRPFEQRVRQLELALERWRWLPRSFATAPIIVNIPAFRLYAFRGLEDREDDMLAMDVVVGAAYKGETPVFAAEMKYVIFRPYWEVPASIQKYEYARLVRTERENLERLGYVLVSAKGNDDTPLPLTPENVKRMGKDLRLRQLPGRSNALGLVKFMLPNPYDIYLHDTPAKGLFLFSRRDISHGCIRVSDPAALALHVLRNEPGWTAERVREAMEGTENDVRVDLSTPIPVLIQYATALVGDDGQAYFYSDVYKLDQELDALLRKGEPYPR